MMPALRTLLAAALVAASGRSASADGLRVFAAASLTDAFRELAAVYERRHGDPVELNLAGSPTLRTQIEQGAPADVFASADREHAEALREAGILEAPRVFARNALVVVAPDRDRAPRSLADLARPGVKIVVAAAAVPAGRYASEVLARLDAAHLFGNGFRSRVEANVVSHETDVRAVLSKVVLGEADAGFVYATDAAAVAGRVRRIEIPGCCTVAAEYAIGTVTGRAASARARAFVDLVLSGDGQAILRRHGFAR